MSGSDSAPDSAAVASVDDHVFTPRDEPWGLCVCGLSQAAHAQPGEPYRSTAPRAKPEAH